MALCNDDNETVVVSRSYGGCSIYSIVSVEAGWACPWLLVAESSAGAFAWNAHWLTVESARALDTRVP